MKSAKQPSCNLFLIILSTLFIIIPLASLDGQKQEVDAVYLNNGEVFRGILQDQLDPGIVQLQTLCWNTMLFSKSEISRIEKEKIDFRVYGGSTGTSSHGYFNRTDLGALIGSGNNEKNTIFSAQMVNGYKIGRRYFPGIGVGIEFYEYTVVPVYADFSYFITDHGVRPFLRGSFGYSIPLENSREEMGVRTDNRGGFLYVAGIGTSIRTGPASAMVISMVYRFQNLRSIYTQDWNDEVLDLEKQYNRISLRIGFMFD